jgi:hypothetical protein
MDREVVVERDVTPWHAEDGGFHIVREWEEGNSSCDCNRLEHVLGDGDNYPCGEGIVRLVKLSMISPDGHETILVGSN